jgi:hypothetical protein
MSPVLPIAVAGEDLVIPDEPCFMYEVGHIGYRQRECVTGEVYEGCGNGVGVPTTKKSKKKKKKRARSVERASVGISRQRLQQLLLAEIRAFNKFERLRETETVVTTLLGEKHVVNVRKMCLEQRSKEEMEEEEMRLKLHAEQKAALLRRWSGKDADPSEAVYDGLRVYVGSSSTARNGKALKKIGVTHILNASAIVPCYFEVEQGPGSLKAEYLKIPIFDDESIDIRQYFHQVFEFIDQGSEHGSVLVHCCAGQSRSVAFVLAYLMYRYGIGLDEALASVRVVRPCAAPNEGFMKQLRSFDEELQCVRSASA